MSKKFKLFASVAAPLVSLPLMIQPAGAVPPKAHVEGAQMPGVVQVQERLILPPGAEGGEGEGQERPRRQQRESQGGGGGEEQERPRRQQSESQGEGGGERQERRERQREEAAPQEEQRPRRQREAEPEAAPRREQPAAEAPAEQRPQRRQQAEDQGERERPQRRQQQEAGQDEGGSDRQQRREKQREQAAPEQERPSARETEEQQQAEPETREREQRRNARDRNAVPSEDQAETPSSEERPADRAATPEGERERPARRNAEGEQPPARDRAADTADEARPATDGQATQGEQQGRDRMRRSAGEAEGNREIGRDADSARRGQQTLPVENGAAVLDSAKEQPSAAPGGERQRPRREAPQEAEQQTAPPKTDAEAQSATRVTEEQQEVRRALLEQEGERLDARPDFERPRGWEVRDRDRRDRDRDRDRDRRGDRDRDDARVIISIGDRDVVRHDDSRRFYRDGREPEYIRLRDGRVREVIVRDDGTRIVTVRNRYGEIVQRSRIAEGGDEYVLYYAPTLIEDRRGPDYVWRDPGDELPPMRLTVPVEDYIIDTSSDPDRDYYEFLEQPPVEQVERVYSLDEVRYSARIRDKVPRIDLDTITFATGSAEIPMNQASSLRRVADAINKILEDDPSETFLIEGHTDAVGSDESNLILSDERAESVAVVLADAFGIPPENLATQGYGERYLKIRTEGPEQENRRVTIRRITPLVKPVASNQ